MLLKQSWLVVLVLMMAAVSGCSTSPPNGGVSGDRVKIFASTKYKGVELLFTESVEKYAQADGSNYDHAIREVGWDLISAIGDSAKATPELQAILFNRINYKEKQSFVVLGIFVNGKFLRLNKSGQSEDPSTMTFLEELARRSVVVLLAANEPGVEMFISRK